MVKLTKRKGFNFFRSYYDVYNELETNMDKVAFIDALLDRQFLGVKPLELKGMAKFAYISQTNSIDSQVKGYNDKMIKLGNPIIGGNSTPTYGGQTTPTLQEKEKEEVQVQVEDRKKERFLFRKELLNLGVEENLLDDFLLIRKKKKNVNSQTAFDGILREVGKTDLSLNESITICVERSWSSFKAEWVNKGKDESKNKTASQDWRELLKS